MDPESAGIAGIIGAALVAALRIIERTVDQKKGNGPSSKLEVRISLAEQKMAELKESVDELKDKTVEGLKLMYEFREAYRIDKAKTEAKDEIRREGGANVGH